MTEPTHPESGRSFEEIAQEFITNYENYRLNPESAKYALGKHPEMIFRYREGKDHRDGFFLAALAYVALPESPGERKRLIENRDMSAFTGTNAMSALIFYSMNGGVIRHELNADWRNVLAERTAGKIYDQHHPQYSEVDPKTRDTLKRVHVEKTLDMVMKVIPLPKSRDIIQMAKDAEQMDIFEKKEKEEIRTARAYLEEFIVGPKK